MLSTQIKVPPGRFFFTNGFSGELLQSALKDFASAYLKKYGEPANAGAVAGYHAAQLLYDAIQREGRAPGSQTINVAGWKGQFDAKNRFQRPLVVNEVTASGFKMREIIND